MDNNIEISNDQPKSKKSVNFIKSLLLILVGIVLFIGSGYLGYYLRDQSANAEIGKKKTEITNLSKSVSDLQKQLDELNADKSFAVSSCDSTANKNISASKIENIQASITSKNTAALEGYMADTVCFAIAASDGIGDISATNAIENITNYIENTDGWTFAPTTSETNSYKSGNYATFFVDGVIIGKSSDNKILLFSFNDAGKIDVVFWSSAQSELM